MFCSQLFQNSDNRTTYTVQRREEVQGLTNTLRYPLVENMDYVVRVRNISCVYACGVGRGGGLFDSIVIVLVPQLVHEDSFLCLVSPPQSPFTTLSLLLHISSFFRYLLPTQLVMDHPQRM